MTQPGAQRARPLLLAFMFACSFLLAAGASAENNLPPSRVIFVGDIWRPYNCSPEAKDKGALVDLLAHEVARDRPYI